MTVPSSERNPEALEQTASRLEDLARQMTQVAQSTQDYQGKVGPIAQGVEHEVGASATGKDQQIAALLTECARSMARSASASHQAAEAARKLAAEARAEAQAIRRQQQAQGNGGQQAGRR